MKMLKISLLHPFSAKAIGLNEKDLYNLHSKPHENALRVLQIEGYKVSIDYFTGCLIPYAKNINTIKKRFWPISSPLFIKRHRWRHQHAVLHLIYSYFFTPDLTVINMSGHGSSYIFKLAKIIKRRNKEYIAIIGGMHMSTSSNALHYYKNAHHIIVHTQIQKNALNKIDSFKDIPIKVLPLGVDTSLFKTKLKKSSKSIELLCVGRISRLKQIELTINTLLYIKTQTTKQIHLNIVGPYSDIKYYKELLNLIEVLKLKDNITFKGILQQDELISYYQNANLLLLPSAHESFGMVMVEAMACGTPVAALLGSGGPDELIEDGVNGLLCSKENYKDRILEFIFQKDLQNLMRENSRKLVIEKWSLDKTISSFRSSIIDVFK